MTNTISVEFEGYDLELELDYERSTWIPFEETDSEMLGKRTFPLVAIVDGSRYELFGDGTFARHVSRRYDVYGS